MHAYSTDGATKKGLELQFGHGVDRRGCIPAYQILAVLDALQFGHGVDRRGCSSGSPTACRPASSFNSATALIAVDASRASWMAAAVALLQFGHGVDRRGCTEADRLADFREKLQFGHGVDRRGCVQPGLRLG